jgi:hypothetical protein
VRELPRGQLVPPDWEEHSSAVGLVAFRYRAGAATRYSVDSSTGRAAEDDASTVYLALSSSGLGEDVVVTFGTIPKKGASPPDGGKAGGRNPRMNIPLGRHFNLDGFRAAKARAGGGGAGGGGAVPPSLFYVALADLLRRFFDGLLFDGALPGGVRRPAAPAPSSSSRVVAVAMDAIDDRIAGAPGTTLPPPPSLEGGGPDGPPRVDDDGAPPRAPPGGGVDPPRPPPIFGGGGGDFEADLLPSGLPRPGAGSLTVPPPGGGGNQVGPDHPIFDREFGEYDDDQRRFGGGGVDGGGFGLPGMGGMMGMRPRRVLRKANLLSRTFRVFPRPCFTLEASSFL